ncbi:hypothetical protein CFRS1_v013888 [Colletotrichum fructicola]|nr:hypothetical protein CFRS1_v013888 [Colletotrichum fructicola]
MFSEPSFRIDLWAYIQLHTFTFARLSDYSESSARRGSGVGLYFKNATFGVFKNEQGNPEFAMECQKQLKGKEWVVWATEQATQSHPGFTTFEPQTSTTLTVIRHTPTRKE